MYDCSIYETFSILHRCWLNWVRLSLGRNKDQLAIFGQVRFEQVIFEQVKFEQVRFEQGHSNLFTKMFTKYQDLVINRSSCSLFL